MQILSTMGTKLKLGDIIEAEITRITDFGAFAKINERNLGLIHISQISNSFVKDVKEHLKVGDRVKARVIKLGPGKKIDLSLKTPQEKAAPEKAKKSSSGSPAQRFAGRPGPPAQKYAGRAGFKSSDFEDKLDKFLSSSR